MRMIRLFLALVLCLAAAPHPARAQAQDPGRWTLTILHSNDVHSRLQPVNRFDSTCTGKEQAEGQCLGGMARLAHKAREIVAEVEAASGNVVLLDAGDQFQGSLFYTLHKGAAELAVMNLVPYDAMVAGNHEFDGGPAQLAAFVRGARFPVLGTNIDATGDADLRGLLRDVVVLERGGRRIGVIGLSTEDTPSISSPGPGLRFLRAEDAARAAVDRLRREGVDIVVALSHLGLARDRALAAAVDGIDVIVGGHSHSLLSNSAPNAEGPYPVVVRSPAGQDVLVVQAYAYARFLGRLDVTFDAAGVPVSWSGDTIPLLRETPEDTRVAAEVARLAVPLEALRARVIGAVAVDLPHAECRRAECLVGNVVADAVLEQVRHLGVTAAIQNGGGLRASIPRGDVTMGQVLTVLPFQNTIATMGIRGRDLLEALENGVGAAESGSGRFPQVAGMRFTWDPAAPAGRRIVAVEMRGADGNHAPLDPEAVYKVATNQFLRRGGDGYVAFRDRAIEPYDFGPGLEEALAAYIEARSPVQAGAEGRIRTR